MGLLEIIVYLLSDIWSIKNIYDAKALDSSRLDGAFFIDKIKIMDQCPFEFQITVVGCDIEQFIQMLRDNGFYGQADLMQESFTKQLEDF